MFVPGIGSLFYGLVSGVNDARREALENEWMELTGRTRVDAWAYKPRELRREVTRLRAERTR